MMKNNNEVQYNFVGKQINRTYKLPSYESQQKDDNSDFELESPLKEQQNKQETQADSRRIIKLISSTEPIGNDQQQKEMSISQSLTLSSQNKENTLNKRGSVSQRDININEFLENENQHQSSATNFQQMQIAQPNQAQYKVNMGRKLQLERIQENDDEKVNSSIQNTSTQQSREFRKSSANKTLQEIDGKIKEVLNNYRFQDLQNLLEESKNMLKNDVQVILDGLENDQILIQNKINELQEEYNHMVFRKSQNQEVDEERFLQIERNIQKQINYLQSLRLGLQQSQKNMGKPFQKKEVPTSDTIPDVYFNTQQSTNPGLSYRTQEPQFQGYRRINSEMSNTVSLGASKTPSVLRQINKTEDVRYARVDDGTQTDIKSSNSTSQYNSRQNTRGLESSHGTSKVQTQQSHPQNSQENFQQKQDKKYQQDPQLFQQKIFEQHSQKEQQLPDLYKKNKEQNDQRKQEVRKFLELEEQKLNNIKLSDIDINRKTMSKQWRQGSEQKQQVNENGNSFDQRPKKCLSAMKPKYDQSLQVEGEQDKEMLMQRLNNRKEFSQTIRGIFHSSSKNRMQTSPEIQNNANSISAINITLPNNSIINDQDKSRYKSINKTQKLDLNEVKILPRENIRKRATNHSFMDSRNKQIKTPDAFQSEANRTKRLDYSFNQFTPLNDQSSQGNHTNHSRSTSNNGGGMTSKTYQSKFNQQSDSSICNIQTKSINKALNIYSSKDSGNMAQILNKNASQISKQKRTVSQLDPLDQTQNSYLHNQCSWKSKVDYMHQVKQKFKLQSSPENWKKIANDQDIEHEIKIEQLKQFSKMLGIKAKRKIQLSRVKSKNGPNQFFLNDDLIEADELIINSIKAKLAIIETVNNQYDEQYISEQGESLEQSLQNLDTLKSKKR